MEQMNIFEGIDLEELVRKACQMYYKGGNENWMCHYGNGAPFCSLEDCPYLAEKRKPKEPLTYTGTIKVNDAGHIIIPETLKFAGMNVEVRITEIKP